MAYYQDLSYLTAKDGTKIKPKRLIKSSRVSKNTLRKLKIKKLIDLRTFKEKDLVPDKYDDYITYMHLPYFDMRITGITYEKNMLLNQLNDIRTMEETYREMVTNPKYVNNLSAIIKEIVNSNEFPIIYHCSCGKDRTGITTFVLLHLLGFDNETIMKDYLLLSDANKVKSFLAYVCVLIAKRDVTVAKKIKGFMEVDEKYLNAAIDAINETYGSVDSFIYGALNISFFEQENFKNKVLVKKEAK